MNEATLMQLKVLVERAVRPVSAALRNKQKMREEMLAHVIAVFEEEMQAADEEAAALARTAERFGDPAELTAQLQATVPRRDAFDRLLDRVWFRPGEPTLRRAVRHALLTRPARPRIHGRDVRRPVRRGRRPARRLCRPRRWSFTPHRCCSACSSSSSASRSWPNGCAACWRRGRGVRGYRCCSSRSRRACWCRVWASRLWLDGTHANVRDLLVVFALGLVVPGMVVHLAKSLATRLRDHREWASLPLDGTSV